MKLSLSLCANFLRALIVQFEINEDRYNQSFKESYKSHEKHVIWENNANKNHISIHLFNKTAFKKLSFVIFVNFVYKYYIGHTNWQ